ncbi:MAG: acyl--CoA ligase [Bacilli bacterium]|nr:acyl--CoA ligase [Bacilli bacterium]
MNEEKILTGYPHLDKPWMKWYKDLEIPKDIPRMNIYDYLREKTKSFVSNNAITYYGKSISYGKFYDNIDIAAGVLTSFGVDKGNRILYIMPNIPETAYTFYGTAKIGAVSDYIDPRPDSVDLKVSANKVFTIIKDEKINHIVAFDRCYLALIKPIENELKDFGIKKIIITSATDSMDFINIVNYMIENASFNGLSALKKSLLDSKKYNDLLSDAIKKSPIEIVRYSDLVKDCAFVKTKSIEYEPNFLNSIVHSSGTSSTKPKPIPLTNDNLNSYVQQTFCSNMPMNEGDNALHILPYFAAYGLSNVVHSGFCHGNNLIQIPEFNPINLGKLIVKYKPQTIIGTPSWFLNMMDDKRINKSDLSHLKMVTYGGDTMEASDEEIFNDFLKSHGCNVKLTKGHGMSETSGCSSFANGEYNVAGTAGIPLSKTTYGIVDSETKKPVRYSEEDYVEGEIIINTQAMTSGELDGVKYTKTIELDGKEYVLTGDIARMDKNGIITFLARTDRSFTRFDGYKIKPYEIEKIIKMDKRVKYCMISNYYDQSKKGNMPIANIVLEENIFLNKDELLEMAKEIITNCFVKNIYVSSRQIPSKIKFIDALPLTKNGKIDFKSLKNQELEGDEISVDVEETNISLGEISFHYEESQLVLKKDRK